MARGTQRFTNTNSFAKNRSGGPRTPYLKWRKETGGKLQGWLSTKELPMKTFRHGIPMVQIRDDKDDRSKKVKHVWSRMFVCHETVETLEANWRDKDTGERKHPYERCGLCKLTEWCYQQAMIYEETRDEKKPKGLSAVTPLFHFESDEPEETTTLHVGGLCNLFGDDDLSAELKADIKKAKIRLDRAWMENAKARCQYAMFVVDNAHPEAGVQIAVEAKLLGDKVKELMEDELEKNEVDIQKRPYCMEWEYRPSEKEFSKKYKATVVRKNDVKIKPTGRILALIRGEVPKLPEDVTEPFNQQSMRTILENHCVLPDKSIVPWAELFPSKEQTAAWDKEDAEANRKEKAQEEAAEKELAKESEDVETEDDDDDEDDEESDDEDDNEDDEESDDEDDEEDDESIECDDCETEMKLEDTECSNCGATYDPDTGKLVAHGKKKMKTRAEAIAAKRNKENGAGKAKKKTAKAKSDEEEPEVGEDGLPF
jgi:hypothetical protein